MPAVDQMTNNCEYCIHQPRDTLSGPRTQSFSCLVKKRKRISVLCADIKFVLTILSGCCVFRELCAAWLCFMMVDQLRGQLNRVSHLPVRWRNKNRTQSYIWHFLISSWHSLQAGLVSPESAQLKARHLKLGFLLLSHNTYPEVG